ncbi:hypothetical protein KIN20_022873 [Parelaphostrongylus tenuis]|uniref:Vacuolar ATPase assembly protein VMA22 n=1 Tax=Parelaphostrongylus tenuis TaxID=148309 RepID=A0AAD5N9J6_PARTN|nr:hypothetical protein KIN20_022873 [Parelaphostrongylus tenuis]
MEELNSLSLERLEYVANYCNLAKQLEDRLVLARSEISKARTVRGLSFTTLYNINVQSLEPSVRVLLNEGKFELVDGSQMKDKEGNDATELRHRKDESSDAKVEQQETTKPLIPRFRPFGILEPSSAKEARRTIHSALQIICELVTLQNEIKRIDSKLLAIKETLTRDRDLSQKLDDILQI